MRSLAETFGALSHNLFGLVRPDAGSGGPRRTLSVAVTSACLGEGKTTVARGLALHAAVLGQHKILLADANFERPSLTAGYAGIGAAGMADFLTTSPGERPVLLPGGADNLSVVGAGRSPDAMMLFREDAVGRFVRWAAESFDIVLLDCGAFDTAATKAVTAQVDRILLVVDAGRTRRAEIRRAVDMVDDPGRILGVVLNKQRRYLPGFLERAT